MNSETNNKTNGKTTNRAKDSANIHSSVLKIIQNSDKPNSTREIALKTDRAWHSIQTHCLKLQIEGKIDGFKVGNMNLWVIKKEESN
ncbi:MAG: hypothetical protein KAK00_00730 [Nanoarchaeota archaeon]|nr:hypothetical protein [Nanoarchaeota archaeon]